MTDVPSARPSLGLPYALERRRLTHPLYNDAYEMDEGALPNLKKRLGCKHAPVAVASSFASYA